MDQVVQRLDNMHMYEDEDDVELKRDMVNYYLLSNTIFEPSCYEHTCYNDDMKDEINSIIRNDSWELCELHKEKKCVRPKLIYKTKYNSDGTVERFK